MQCSFSVKTTKLSCSNKCWQCLCKLWISWSFTFLHVTALRFFRFSFKCFILRQRCSYAFVRFRHKSSFRDWQTLNCCGPSLNTFWWLHTSQRLEHSLEMRQRFCSLPTSNSAIIPPPPPDVKVKSYLVEMPVRLIFLTRRLGWHVKE